MPYFRHCDDDWRSPIPDEYDLCEYAHSEEELDEWKERWEWRRMMRRMAKQEHAYSYMDELLEEYDRACSVDQGITVVGGS